MRFVSVIAAAAIGLAGCQGEVRRPHTVIEFLEDEALLERTWAACRNDPGGLGRTPDCVNAGHANSRLMMLGRERAIASLKGKD